MRFMKRKLAAVLAVLLMLPSWPALADNTLPQSTIEQSESTTTVSETEKGIYEAEDQTSAESTETGENQEDETKPEETSEETESGRKETAEEIKDAATEEAESAEEVKVQESNRESEKEKLVSQIISTVQRKVKSVAESEDKELLDAGSIATPSNLPKDKIPEDEVKFNTGNHVWSLVSQEDFWENETGDACFEEDGSYTINIPEENPFFPYEVQFTYKGKTENKWFMTPDDSVEVGGHPFYVSANFDDTVVTQMSLEVAGETVVVYPKKKRFTNDGDGISQTSLLPLQERELEIDLSSYSPIELTMVSVDQIFTGTNALGETDKVLWSYNGDSYRVSQKDGYLNLGKGTADNEIVKWQMIVGEDNQLAADNVRYIVAVKTVKFKDWLNAVVFKEDSQGVRTPLSTSNCEYYTYSLFGSLRISVPRGEVDRDDNFCIGLSVKGHPYGDAYYDNLVVHYNRGAQPRNLEEALKGEVITQEIFGKADINGGGYVFKSYMWITLISYDSSGNVTGWLPLSVRVNRRASQAVVKGMYEGTGAQRIPVLWAVNDEDDSDDAWWTINCELNLGYAAEKEYYLVLGCERAGVEYTPASAVAFEGRYSTIKEAQETGAKDISASLLDESKGYKADYSQGVYFTIFIGNSGDTEQGNPEDEEVLKCYVKTKVKGASDDTDLIICGLKDENGNDVAHYLISEEMDSYGGCNYPTFLVDENVNLKKLAPVWNEKNQKIYAAGSNTPESNGRTLRDFSDGPVQYTIISESGKTKNYWLQVVKKTSGLGKLYINSLADKAAETYEKDGVVYTTREMFLSDWYDYQHNILLVNVGTQDIPDLKAELVSNEVELSSYWTLKGGHSLAGFGPVEKDVANASHGELPNLARLCIEPRSDAEFEYIEDGDEYIEWVKDISGTLTIKSGDKVLMVMTLTGIMGNPGFTTEEIPDGVKYVPYGTMIQNSSKYSGWDGITYTLTDGKLPAGMRLLPNGELYGVPTETGEFTFTVRMNSTREFWVENERTFTFTVTENTDVNVDGSTDPGYELTQRVPDITMSAVGDYTMVSKGEYEEFVDVFLDGEKLVKDTDYTSEAGSTRITIRSQTLKRSNQAGVHTLGIEFRTKGTNLLRRAAQNFRITDTGISGNQSGSSSQSSRSSSGSSDDTASQIYKDPKKGYVHKVTGIITGEKAGYSKWQQDEKGWKLIYADKTVAVGYMTVLESGETAEQIIWEKINGSWYAFGVDGYLKSGWVYDYRLGSWYSLSVDTGMLIGWYKDPTDNHTYYLDPVEGGLSAGWRNIESKWYYFNTKVTETSWVLNKETNKWQYNARSRSKPLGAMLYSEKTPDGYFVGADGVWDGKEKQ